MKDADGLPTFDPKKIYLLRGASLNSIIDTIHANRVRVVQGGGLKIVSQSDQGKFLAVDGTECTT